MGASGVGQQFSPGAPTLPNSVDTCQSLSKQWHKIGEIGKHEWRQVVAEDAMQKFSSYYWCLKCDKTKWS